MSAALKLLRTLITAAMVRSPMGSQFNSIEDFVGMPSNLPPYRAL